MGKEWRTNLARLAARLIDPRCPFFEVGRECDNVRSLSESIEAMGLAHSTETTSKKDCSAAESPKVVIQFGTHTD